MSAKLERVHPSNPSTSRGSFTHLSTDPTGTKIVYCQSRIVVIRPISGVEGTIIYAQHSHPTTVARISPSGYYCASADSAGNVRIWDLVGQEQVLKLEIRALGGRITDLVWDSESKRIGVVGEGKDRFGHYFLVDSGSSCGEVTGHSKVANAIAIKHTRPFRAATASDDGSIVFYTGVPFKYSKTINHHQNFVQTLAFAPDGSFFASGGSDGQLLLYDGTSGDIISSLSAMGAVCAHRGTLFSCAFSADSRLLASCGADGVVNLWNVQERKIFKSIDLSGKNAFRGGSKADDQLVGCTFLEKGEAVAALNLAGEITLITLQDGSTRKLLGGTRSIAVKGLVRGAHDHLLAGSVDGRVFLHKADEDTRLLSEASSSSAIVGLSANSGTTWAITMDDTVRRFNIDLLEVFSTPTTGQPLAIASGGRDIASVTVIATSKGVDLLLGISNIKRHVPFHAAVSSVAISTSGKLLAIGMEDSKVSLFSVSDEGGDLHEETTFGSGRSAITSLSFSTDEALLAAGEGNGKINVYDLKDKKIRYNQWVFHTARINALEFSPDNTHAISASLDTNVYIWSTLRPMKSIAIKNAFAGGATGACWLDNQTVACSGADGCVKVYAITRHL